VDLACVPPLTEDSRLRDEIPELVNIFLVATRNVIKKESQPGA
jgi:hypothetical protein